MVNVTLDEITLNAIKAALDNWAKHLEVEILRYQGRVTRDFPKANENDQRALVWNVAALHETKMAREYLSDPEVVPEQADDMTAAKAYADLGYHDAQARYQG